MTGDREVNRVITQHKRRRKRRSGQGTERLIVYPLSTRETDRDGEINRVLTQHKRRGQGTERLIVYSLSTHAAV